MPLRIRRQDHRAAVQVTIVDDLEEDVGGVRTVTEIADLVHHADMRVCVRREDGAGIPVRVARERLWTRAVPVGKRASKPFWITR